MKYVHAYNLFQLVALLDTFCRAGVIFGRKHLVAGTGLLKNIFYVWICTYSLYHIKGSFGVTIVFYF